MRGLPSYRERKGHQFSPWHGKIPHATGQLSPCGITTVPAFQIPSSTVGEATAMSSASQQRVAPALHK